MGQERAAVAARRAAAGRRTGAAPRGDFARITLHTLLTTFTPPCLYRCPWVSLATHSHSSPSSESRIAHNCDLGQQQRGAEGGCCNFVFFHRFPLFSSLMKCTVSWVALRYCQSVTYIPIHLNLTHFPCMSPTANSRTHTAVLNGRYFL